jgi:hypothetical protein
MYKTPNPDVVWLRNIQHEFRTKFKNRIRRSGPYEVEQVDARRNRYKIKDWLSQELLPSWYSVHRLSPCVARAFDDSLGAQRKSEHASHNDNAPAAAAQTAPELADDAVVGSIAVEYDHVPAAGDQGGGARDVQRRRILDLRYSADGPVALVQQQVVGADGTTAEWNPQVFQVHLAALPATVVVQAQRAKRTARTGQRSARRDALNNTKQA